MLDAAAAIVVAPFAVGPTNLANLEDLLGRAGTRPLLIVLPPAEAPRDFTGGAATRLLSEIVGEGAIQVPDAATALRVLSSRLSATA